ncbi:MAG: roadblock/LC7 domain-containing protein [Syntrophaceae bacterium]|jgi:predicted regulator of Ras-like GTPase activity (Roadblock/LC7/MglB family)
MNLVLGRAQLDSIDAILTENLLGIGAQTAILIDTAGNIVVVAGNGSGSPDVYSLAALAAANFGAMNSMAQIIGEHEFSLLFHKGQRENIHLSKVNDNFLLLNIFNNQVSLGFLRLKVTKVIEELLGILEGEGRNPN